MVTTSYAGDVIVDVQGLQGRDHIKAVANLETATMHPLDQRLWLEWNLLVDYGGRLSDPASVPFGLEFDPGEVERVLRVPFGSGSLAREPFEACVFPFAQHYRTTSFPEANTIRDRDELERAVRAMCVPGVSTGPPA